MYGERIPIKIFSAGLYLALILTVASGCKRNSDTYSSETGESGPVSQISCRNRNGAEDLLRPPISERITGRQLVNLKGFAWWIMHRHAITSEFFMRPVQALSESPLKMRVSAV